MKTLHDGFKPFSTITDCTGRYRPPMLHTAVKHWPKCNVSISCSEDMWRKNAPPARRLLRARLYFREVAFWIAAARMTNPCVPFDWLMSAPRASIQLLDGYRAPTLETW